MYGPRPNPTLPTLGCLSLVAVITLLCLMPFIMVDLMRTALERLHLSPAAALLAVLGIFAGSLINLPLYRIERVEPQPVELMGVLGLWPWMPQFQRMQRDTIVAVNVGGCLIPSLLAIWLVSHILDAGGEVVLALLIATAINTAVCYLVARPVAGVGIMMPVFASPLTAVASAWIMVPREDAALMAPVAFVAGVSGPLLGADLLHLRDITKVSVGMLSIGGAGTFDGIVLSGFLAALLA